MVESKFQTSFIPKKPLDTTSDRSSRQSPSLLRLISILIFIISLILWGGVFLYKSYLQSRISNATSSLKAGEKEFDPKTVTVLSRLNDRLNSAGGLLGSHLASSKIFDQLQTSTLKTVRFTDFGLAYGVNNTLTLSLKGQALSYADVAAQSDALDANPIFKNPIFSNLDLDSTGKVSFSVVTTLDKKDFLFTNGVAVNNEAPPVTPPTNSPFNKQ